MGGEASAHCASQALAGLLPVFNPRSMWSSAEFGSYCHALVRHECRTDSGGEGAIEPAMAGLHTGGKEQSSPPWQVCTLQVLGEVPVWKSGLNEFWREARLNLFLDGDA